MQLCRKGKLITLNTNFSPKTPCYNKPKPTQLREQEGTSAQESQAWGRLSSCPSGNSTERRERSQGLPQLRHHTLSQREGGKLWYPREFCLGCLDTCAESSGSQMGHSQEQHTLLWLGLCSTWHSLCLIPAQRLLTRNPLIPKEQPMALTLDLCSSCPGSTPKRVWATEGWEARKGGGVQKSSHQK